MAAALTDSPPVPTDERAKVLVADPLHEDTLAEMDRRFDLTVRLRPQHDELCRLVREVDVLVMRSGIRVDAEVLTAAKRLKIIARAGSGVDNIDLQTATRRRVLVFRVAKVSSRSVAELAFGLALCAARHIAAGDRWIRRGEWRKADCLGGELRGKTLGTVGWGSIGRELATVADGFGMNVVATVRDLSAERTRTAAARGIRLEPLPVLLAESDVVCLALPLTDETCGLIGSEQLQLMKPTALLINVARSEVVDAEALEAALREGRIGAVGLDVHQSEEGRSRFDCFDNVVMTPHIGAMTRDSQKRIGQRVIDGIVRALEQRTVPGRVC